jgi:recombination protein RecT
MAKARISKTEKKALETKERIDNTLKQLAATNQDQATVPTPAAQPPAPPAQYTQEQIAVHNFKKQIESYEAKILPELLMQHGISPLQFKQTVINEVKRNEKLLHAFIVNPASMFASILAGAEIGLIPSEMIGEFFLIPRNLKQPNGSYKLTVTPLIGYKGLVNLILRSGNITKIHTEVVYEGDLFEPTYGLEPDIKHIPDFTKPRTADKITFVYAVAKKKTGEYQFEVLSRAQVIAIKNMSKYDNELYFNDKGSPNRWMERKAALIQLSKMLEKDYYSKKAIQMDGMLEGGAYLTLDENNQVKLIEGATIKPPRYRNIYGTLNNHNQE